MAKLCYNILSEGKQHETPYHTDQEIGKKWLARVNDRLALTAGRRINEPQIQQKNAANKMTIIQTQSGTPGDKE